MPSIGKDLAAIRSHLGYSVEDVQQSTKIPLVTLKSIEDGSIFEQTDEIKTYVRSFVRSYGRAIKLNDDILVEALNQQEKGKYNHLLLSNFPQLQPKETKKPDSESTPKEEPKEKKEKPAKSPIKKEVAPKDEAPKESKPSNANSSDLKEPPGVRNVDWADMGKRFTAEKKKAPVWVAATVVIAIILFGAIYLLATNGLFSSEEIDQPTTEERTPTQPEREAGGDLSLDLSDEPQNENLPAAELDDILYITLYAATDRLDPVRVYSDEKPRIDPYWMNQGQAYNFEFRDTIRIRGQYSQMLLFLNGHLIENPRQEHFNPSENAIELTRDLFEDDPKWANPIELELPENISPPDSLIDRPRF